MRRDDIADWDGLCGVNGENGVDVRGREDGLVAVAVAGAVGVSIAGLVADADADAVTVAAR